MTQLLTIAPTLGIGAVLACLAYTFFRGMTDHNMGPDNDE